jgi:hypothetical protein
MGGISILAHRARPTIFRVRYPKSDCALFPRRPENGNKMQVGKWQTHKKK